MNKHRIEFSVVIYAEEMDGTPYQSAEIFLGLVEQYLIKEIPHDITVSVTDYREVETSG